MNQKEALEKLNSKKIYIDEDVFQIISDEIKKNIREETQRESEKENDKFNEKVIILLNKGFNVITIKNMILSDLYLNKILLKKMLI